MPENKDKGWIELVCESKKILKNELERDNPNIRKVTQEIETILEPIGQYSKEFHIHCVGYAHIDMNWLWSYQETVAAVNDTFITVLKLMDEFPDFCFSQSQGAVYDIIRKFNPEVFNQIKRRVIEGRWEVIASQWVEGDKNIPSGESIIRHMLYTRAFMKENLGLMPEDVSIAWEPDTFGHAASIPALMLGGGVKQYSFCRNGKEELPPLFLWQAPDGSEIIVNHEQTWYNDPLGTHNTIGLLKYYKKSNIKNWMLVFGIGDHGGGPTRRDLKTFEEMKKWPIFPDFKFSTTKKFFSSVENNKSKLPIIKKELNFIFRGCYISKNLIKASNRFAENLIEEAEVSSVLASQNSNFQYPFDELKKSWLSILFGHFHDILPGCGISSTTHYHSAKYQETAAVSGMIKTNALRIVASHIDTQYFEKLADIIDLSLFSMGAGAGVASHKGGISDVNHSTDAVKVFTVFNPSSWERNEVVYVKIWDSERDNMKKKTFTAFFADGCSVVAHRITDGMLWEHGFVELAVPVSVKALGYTSLAIGITGEVNEYPIGSFGYPNFEYLRDQEEGKVVNCATPLEMSLSYAGKYGMENDMVKVLFDKNTGGIKSLIHKESDVDFVSKGADMLALEYTLERSDGMSAWKIHLLKQPSIKLIPTSFKPVIMNSMVSTYEAVFKIEKSEVILTYILKSDSPYLEINLKVNWFEIGNDSIGIPGLRVLFNSDLHDSFGIYETPLGSITRKVNSGEVVPTQKWSTIHGKLKNKDEFLEAGCLVLNDSLYNSFIQNNCIGLYLLRSTYEPDPVSEVGEHEFKIAIQPYIGKVKKDLYIRSGMAFNHPLIPVSTDIHTGTLAAISNEMITLLSENVIVTHIKKAENGNALIVRIQETEGKATKFTVSFSKTLAGKIITAMEVDFLEREKNVSIEVNSNLLTLDISAFEIKSLRLISA
ncbi:MAG: glycoside hydrolase family 38 C-terminal domain-containing protein [Verrucomicrobiota bacterium]|nr:glycoside hydrolase family 38 C-terminal domain-containing protein [Verrucomicrobiota bacterium]